MSKKFKNFELMAADCEVLSLQELKTIDSVQSKNFHDHNGFAMIYASSKTHPIIVELAQKHNLHIITMTVTDVGSKTSISYQSGLHTVNREGFLLCKKPLDCWTEEKIKN